MQVLVVGNLGGSGGITADRRRGLIGPGEADDSTISVMSVIPAVPDFVDGSFLPRPAGGRTVEACEACGTAGVRAA